MPGRSLRFNAASGTYLVAYRRAFGWFSPVRCLSTYSCSRPCISPCFRGTGLLIASTTCLGSFVRLGGSLRHLSLPAIVFQRFVHLIAMFYKLFKKRVRRAECTFFTRILSTPVCTPGVAFIQVFYHRLE